MRDNLEVLYRQFEKIIEDILDSIWEGVIWEGEREEFTRKINLLEDCDRYK